MLKLDSDETHLFSDCSEGGDGLVDLGRGVRGRKLCTNPSLIFRNDWVAETYDIDTMLQ